MNLSIVGLGIRPSDHLTLAAIRSLREAARVLYIGDAGTTLAALNIQGARSLAKCYVDGDTDTSNYARLAIAVLAELRQYGQVTLALPGHPRLGVSLIHRLTTLLGTEEPSATVVVQEGISSFATILNDVGFDPLEKGTLIIDANRLLLYKIPLVKQLDCLVYHVSSVANRRTDYRDPAKANRLDLLKEHLLRFYPEEHPLTLVQSASVTGEGASLRHVPLGQLDTVAEWVTFATSLYVPGLRGATWDAELLSGILDEDERRRLGPQVGS